MKVSLTPEELLYLLECAIKSPMSSTQASEFLIRKLKEPILLTLEADEEKKNKEAYAQWSESESKKINDLNAKNTNIMNKVETKRRTINIGDGP